jgi:hypothetical protein
MVRIEMSLLRVSAPATTTAKAINEIIMMAKVPMARVCRLSCLGFLSGISVSPISLRNFRIDWPIAI